jgi:hypothetical protein
MMGSSAQPDSPALLSVLGSGLSRACSTQAPTPHHTCPGVCAELVATQRMEAAEKRKAAEKAARLAQEKERLERERVVRAKVGSGGKLRLRSKADCTTQAGWLASTTAVGQLLGQPNCCGPARTMAHLQLDTCAGRSKHFCQGLPGRCGVGGVWSAAAPRLLLRPGGARGAGAAAAVAAPAGAGAAVGWHHRAQGGLLDGALLPCQRLSAAELRWHGFTACSIRLLLSPLIPSPPLACRSWMRWSWKLWAA